MTEKEIIEFLKKNEINHIAFSFMPLEVQSWCLKHKDEEIFQVIDTEVWNAVSNNRNLVREIQVICLTEDYELS